MTLADLKRAASGMGMPFADMLAKSGAELRVFIEACLDPRDPLNRPSHVTATQGSRSRLPQCFVLSLLALPGSAAERLLSYPGIV